MKLEKKCEACPLASLLKVAIEANKQIAKKEKKKKYTELLKPCPN